MITSGGQSCGTGTPDEEGNDVLKPLPAHGRETGRAPDRGIARGLGRSPDVALTLLLLKLVTNTFQTSGASGGCLKGSGCHVYMSAQAADLRGMDDKSGQGRCITGESSTDG